MRWQTTCVPRARRPSSPSWAEGPLAPKTLAGRLVAITRPAAQCDSLADAIRERGGEPLVFPLIRIEPLGQSAEIQAARAGLGAFDVVFFVSPNAVRLGVDALGGRADWPARTRVATVGAGSRASLEQLGFEQVIAPLDGADSEAVLALPEFSTAALSGKRLLIVRGDGGRDLLGHEARARGAEVQYVSCYRRSPPDGEAEVLLAPARSGRLSALTATSSEALSNLAGLLGEAGLAALRDIPVFVPHRRIADRAARLGFSTIIETAAGDHGLLSGLDAHFGSVG